MDRDNYRSFTFDLETLTFDLGVDLPIDLGLLLLAYVQPCHLWREAWDPISQRGYKAYNLDLVGIHVAHT